MKRKLYSYLTLFSLFTLNSCVKNNDNPSWLEVNKWTLLANADLSGNEGELTQNFTEAWVYINDEVLGVFEVPFKIPVLKSRNVNIKIYPAVKNNGISATKKIYPFVTFYEINAELIKDKTLTLFPTTKYYSETQFDDIEDFEDANLKIEDDPSSLAHLMKGNNPSILKWGNFYGVVDLNITDSKWVAYTADMNLPRGQEVYLEIDYHSTNNLVTGLIALSPSGVKPNPHVRLNAQDESTIQWKKIYIDLREIISNSDAAAYFKQSFEAALDDGESEGQIVSDNVKVVYF